MSNKLTLAKTEFFKNQRTDLYSDGEMYFMTINQLALCLGYSDRKGIEKLIERNLYLKNNEFSTTDVLSVVEGNRTVSREMRLFSEDGIYEIAFLSKTAIAQLFRAWVRKILKELRKQSAQPTKPPLSFVQQQILSHLAIIDKLEEHDKSIAKLECETQNIKTHIEKLEIKIDEYSIHVNPYKAKRALAWNYFIKNCDIYDYSNNPNSEKAKEWYRAISAIYNMYISDIKRAAKKYKNDATAGIYGEAFCMFVQCYNGIYQKVAA